MAMVSAQEAQSRIYDVCVIGAGAAGLALAGVLGRAGLKVLVIERGGFDAGEIPISDRLHNITSPETHDPRALTNRDAVGGTLQGWGGRCMPFDPEDFGARSGKDSLDWPISFEEYARWVAPAAEFLQVDAQFEEPMPDGWTDIPGVLVNRVERLNDGMQADVLQDSLRQGTMPVDLLPRTEIMGTTWGGTEGERHLEVLALRCAGESFSQPCRQVVLACGGLETTRQLLLAQAKHPDLFGGPDGALGHYYMGHLTGSLSEITFRDPQVCSAFRYQFSSGCASPYRRRFITQNVPGETLTDVSTPANIAFWVENIRKEDPRHCSGELSFKHLAGQLGRSDQFGTHLTNILRDPIGVFDGVQSVVGRLGNSKARRPSRLVTRNTGPYALAYHAENFPNKESHVTLSESFDDFGRQRLNVNFDYGDQTIDALIKGHFRLKRRLEEAGVAKLDLPPEDVCATRITEQARDGYHQIGLARMSRSAAEGVVDPDCCAHGTTNLFVASAAVFPVSGQANPTLSVVAFALRLADFLVSQHRKEMSA